jgi:hypothetical protein
MNFSNELYLWLLDVLFIIGILILPVGLGFCFRPDKMFDLAIRMNKSISTDKFFNAINKPRHKEFYFYRHYRVFGMVIVVVLTICLYMLAFHNSIEFVTHVLERVAESEFEKWLFVVLYYILIVAIGLAVVFGVIMFIRPSVLKSFEKWSNHWVDTENSLKVLDRENNMPDKILPGNQPRVFGLFIILGAIYMIWSTWPL